MGHRTEKILNGFNKKISCLLNRQLPKRAIAISNRLQHDYEKESAMAPSAALAPWNHTEMELSDAGKRLDIENQICELAGLNKYQDIYFDWPVANPIRENPEVWVSDPVDRNAVIRINQYFDAEQLSNAYRDVKQIAWVFADQENRAKVAASTACVLQRRYDLILGNEAVRRAKVFNSDYISELKALDTSDEDLCHARDNLIKANSCGTAIIMPTIEQFKAALYCITDDTEATVIGDRLRRQFMETALSRAYYDDFIVALEVLKILMRHSRREWRSSKFKEPIARQNESRFQADLKGFADSDTEALQLFEVSEGIRASSGITDLVFRPKKGKSRPVIVELKSDEQSLHDLYKYHAGQPSQYAEIGYGRISFLYCQFSQGEYFNPADTIELRQTPDQSSQHLILCLGLKAFCPLPSDSGRFSAQVQTS